jgi:hypothetical protein
MQRETKARFFKHPFPDSFFLMIKLNPYSSAEVVFRGEPRLAARCEKVWKRSYNAIASAVFAKHIEEVLPIPPCSLSSPLPLSLNPVLALLWLHWAF